LRRAVIIVSATGTTIAEGSVSIIAAKEAIEFITIVIFSSSEITIITLP
jgi:hypothetical protein